MPRFLGQHFLKNMSAIKKIVMAVEVQAVDTIIEIGPGHGELTIPLAEAGKAMGTKIIAVEKDEKMANELTARIKTAQLDNVEVVRGDILEFLEEAGSVATMQPSHHPPANFKIVGNIPYYLTGHLLHMLSELKNPPQCAIFLIQKEVAERICAAPPRMNRLAASVQFWAEPKIITHVSREDFSPPPQVDSAVILLESKKMVAPQTAERYYAAVRALFAQPRKTILNNLSAGAEITKTAASELLQSLEIDPNGRPQDLSIAQIAALAEKSGIFSSVHK